MNGPYNAIEMEILDNPGYETEGTDGKFGRCTFKMFNWRQQILRKRNNLKIIRNSIWKTIY